MADPATAERRRRKAFDRATVRGTGMFDWAASNLWRQYFELANESFFFPPLGSLEDYVEEVELVHYIDDPGGWDKPDGWDEAHPDGYPITHIGWVHLTSDESGEIRTLWDRWLDRFNRYYNGDWSEQLAFAAGLSIEAGFTPFSEPSQGFDRARWKAGQWSPEARAAAVVPPVAIPWHGAVRPALLIAAGERVVHPVPWIASTEEEPDGYGFDWSWEKPDMDVLVVVAGLISESITERAEVEKWVKLATPKIWGPGRQYTFRGP